MGAHDISFELKGEANWSQINARFKQEQEEGREYNGHREGYSGDFQTVRKVVDHTHKVFDSYGEAFDYCMNTAEKWVSVVAVRYRVAKYVPTKPQLKLEDKISKLIAEQRALENKPVKLSKFVTCEGCRSRVSTAHCRGLKCPVCNEGDFRPLGLQRRIKKMDEKINSLRLKLTELKKETKAKALKKSKEVNTLVAGWGAS